MPLGARGLVLELALRCRTPWLESPRGFDEPADLEGYLVFDFTLSTAVHARAGNVDVIHARSIGWPAR